MGKLTLIKAAILMNDDNNRFISSCIKHIITKSCLESTRLTVVFTDKYIYRGGKNHNTDDSAIVNHWYYDENIFNQYDSKYPSSKIHIVSEWHMVFKSILKLKKNRLSRFKSTRKQIINSLDLLFDGDINKHDVHEVVLIPADYFYNGRCLYETIETLASIYGDGLSIYFDYDCLYGLKSPLRTYQLRDIVDTYKCNITTCCFNVDHNTIHRDQFDNIYEVTYDKFYIELKKRCDEAIREFAKHEDQKVLEWLAELGINSKNIKA